MSRAFKNWIYKGSSVSNTSSRSHDEQEEID